MPSRQSKRKAAKRAAQAAHDVVEGLQDATLKDRSGTDFAAIPSAALFFEDKGGVAVAAKEAAATPAASRKPRKALKSEAILAAGRTAKPLLSEARKRKGGAAPKQKGTQPAQQLQQRTTSDEAVLDLWRSDEPSTAAGKRRKQGGGASVAPPAVAIDAPGCSYNPDTEQHQEAVAAAVAAEIQKAIAQDLQPKAPPVYGAAHAQLDELAMLQVKETVHEDDEAADGAAAATGINRQHHERKTKTQRNKEERRRQVEAELRGRQQRKGLNLAIAQLDQLQSELDAAEATRQAKMLRKQVVLLEKQAAGPPRLGKHQFMPEPMQVLLSEELNGSLRKLKATPTLARERFKSLQQRGIIETRLRKNKKTGRRIASDKFANR